MDDVDNRLLYRTSPELTAALATELAHVVKVDYTSKDQLLSVLEEHRLETVDVQVADVIEMVAELKGVSRSAILQTAIVAWFYHALGHPVLEAECIEQDHSEDTTGGFLLFRVRLDANHEAEVAQQGDEASLNHRFRESLLAALPVDIMARKESSSLDQMIQISWTKSGSIELGGVTAIGLVVLVVMSIGVGMCRSDFCYCEYACPCITRPGRAEGREYAMALRELRDRGAEFEVSPDGSAILRVPPASNRATKWKCFDGCTVL